MYNPLDHRALAAQIQRQQRHAWNLELDIDWELGIEADKPLLRLDSDSIAFPGASAEQRLVLSQLMGLIVNSTIAESEDVINVLRDSAWAKVLRSYPVNPEMWDLGELFFAEEKKHSLAFYRYNNMFCETLGIDPEALDRLLPKAFGSLYLRATQANAEAGGNAFWWTVASVEEVSIRLFQSVQAAKSELDPLFYQVHQRHMEEEARHHNYAFLMLDIIDRRKPNLRSWLHRKTDLLYSQIFSTGWIVSELAKIFRAELLRHEHPFFAVLADCKPLFEKLSVADLARRLLVSAPYVSLMINTKNHPRTTKMAAANHAWSFPFPTPRKASA